MSDPIPVGGHSRCPRAWGTAALAAAPGPHTVPPGRDYTGSPVEETGLIAFCRERGIALLVPEALYEYTFLKCRSKGWLTEKEIDGVEKIIDAVVERFPIDRGGVYLAGISAGAVFSHYLANRRPRFFSALLSPSPGSLGPARAVPPPVA